MSYDRFQTNFYYIFDKLRECYFYMHEYLQVVIKDFVSRAVISQFKAHTSPISALCFDPSGTLLVTASVHGNNINIFRIMPSSTNNGSTNQSFKWSSSHVHLYKLYRGITTAVSLYYILNF